jgi:short-subunit dehydrogenase
MRIEGKVVLITGASEGIGAACVAVFRDRGAQVSLVARSAEKLREVAGAGGFFVAADLTGAEGRREAVRQTIERFGRVDILINNAGRGLYEPAHEASMEHARALFELNFFAPLEMVQLVVPHMKRRGSGAIVNVGSIAGKMTLPWFTLYSASKYALGSLTDGLRMELRGSGIHCINVCPGYVKTRFQQNVLSGSVPPKLAAMRQWSAITAEECAQAIARGVERDARTVMAPASGWIPVFFSRMLPWVVDRQLEKMA